MKETINAVNGKFVRCCCCGRKFGPDLPIGKVEHGTPSEGKEFRARCAECCRKPAEHKQGQTQKVSAPVFTVRITADELLFLAVTGSAYHCQRNNKKSRSVEWDMVNGRGWKKVLTTAKKIGGLCSVSYTVDTGNLTAETVKTIARALKGHMGVKTAVCRNGKLHITLDSETLSSPAKVYWASDFARYAILTAEREGGLEFLTGFVKMYDEGKADCQRPRRNSGLID